ncbi:FixH family protein [Caulobacter sp. 17J65-9]|uniref:FixH family protein n=1 Tax=Caulobacter sp. 17J65-9 TaxID=2709382 RepID=UPI0013CCD268|nr:FixH family protein [Caulobacter sp. 17J65-9]NEX93439.1 FixH family protein [Caulobacter sp. 17J65-9]
MSSSANQSGGRLGRLGHLGAAVLIGALMIAGAVDAAGLDTSLDRSTDQGVFHVQLHSAVTPIPLSKVHRWTVHLTDAAGRPVDGAELAVDGGMPEHGHGLPTAPRATPAATPGDYVINGVKFSMTGWWELKLKVRAPDGRSDRITFNVVL